MFCSDKPIDNSENDLLNRTSFSKQLAKAILSYTSKDNFTISLCGKWGSGKTSILNMVERYIADLTKNDEDDTKPLIIHFNPWNYSDRSQLTVQFFQTLLSKLNMSSNNNALKKVGKALKHYSSFFEYAEFIPMAGKYLKPLKSLVSGLGEGLTDLYDSKTCLEQQKLKVIDALSSQNQKLIVIIDDIDRLNNEQIRLIFQLVNSLAGFPNMIYLLSFDREVVARALSDEQKCNGDEYLEKIIQVPFDVPEINSSTTDKLFFGKVEDIISDELCDEDFDRNYWIAVFQNCISPFVKNLRDINRIINVYRFKYEILKHETNCIDLLALTTFQVCAPSIFEWIYKNKCRITSEHYFNNKYKSEEQEKSRKDFLEEFGKIYNKNPDLMLEALQTLFPIISNKTGGYYHHDCTAANIQRKMRLACPSRFFLYFSDSLNDVAIPNHLLNESIKNYNLNALANFLEKLNYENKLYEYLKELYSHVQDIPGKRLTLFFKVLLIMQTKEEYYKTESRLEIAPAIESVRINWVLLKRLGNESATKLLIALIRNSGYLEFYEIMSLIYNIEQSYGRIGNETENRYRVISEKQLDDIENLIKNRLKLIKIECNILNSRNFSNIYAVWSYLDTE